MARTFALRREGISDEEIFGLQRRYSEAAAESDFAEINTAIKMLKVAICFAASASAFVVPASVPRSCAAATRASCPSMDETILEKALAGELEEEGAENVFMSEVGWASYLDKNAGSSYNMNQRPSLAEDGYFTPDVFSNPVEGACVLRWQ